ncbi:MAG: hypothetical protein AB1659_11685, partial [Thermodesulfobacteriota bacterium]
LGICYAVAAIKKWARILSIFFNIGTAGLYIIYGIGYYGSRQIPMALLSGLIVILFSGSTYFLLIKKTSAFFNERNQIQEEPHAPQS